MAKVLFCTNIIPPYRTTFYEKLSACDGVNLTVAHYKKRLEDGRPAAEGNLNFNTKRICEKSIRIGPYQLLWQKGLIGEFLCGKYDTVVVSGTIGNVSVWILLVLAKITKVKTLMWACGWESKREGSLALKVKKLFYRLFFSLPDKILTYSKKANNYLNGLGVDRRNLFTCFNGIEIDNLLKEEEKIKFQADSLRKSILSSDGTIFLYVGAMLLEKRIDLLIESFSSVRGKYENAYLWIIGDGPDLNHFKEIAEQHRNIKFFGRIVDGVDPYFCAADFFVLPGIGGLALNQALFWRTPCIVSVADGTEDDLVYHEETGFRFISGSVDSLEECLFSAINSSRAKREELGNMGREIIVKRSNVDIMVKIFHYHLLKGS